VTAPSFVISVRFMMALLAFFGYAVQYIQRIDMSVAIVCMVNNTALKMQHSLAQNFTDRIELSDSNTAGIDQVDTCMFKELAKGKSFVIDHKISS
jgi:hypothetical protein